MGFRTRVRFPPSPYEKRDHRSLFSYGNGWSGKLAKSRGKRSKPPDNPERGFSACVSKPGVRLPALAFNLMKPLKAAANDSNFTFDPNAAFRLAQQVGGSTPAGRGYRPFCFYGNGWSGDPAKSRGFSTAHAGSDPSDLISPNGNSIPGMALTLSSNARNRSVPR